jgi:hypothetical protein
MFLERGITMFKLINSIINKQVARGFYFNPALKKWTEVDVNVLKSKFKNFKGVKHPGDRYVHSITDNGSLVAIYAIFMGNENRKDVNTIGAKLNGIYNEVMAEA